MRLFRRLTLVLMFLSMPAGAADLARDLRASLERAASSEGPGLVLLVARGDTVLFRGARGRAQIELGVAMTQDDVFRIASVTKMFTAALVLQLADQGLLSLDDRVDRHLSGFGDTGRITLRQLLSHTSGLSNKAADPQPGFSRREVDTATYLTDLRKRPLDFEPGSKFTYSNAGYILLGAVIEQVTGKHWHEALQEILLTKLKLSHTRYGSSAPIVPGRVAGYTTATPDHRVANADFISISVPAAAGALESTADDLLRWMRALRRTQLDNMRAPVALADGTVSPYGLGLYRWQVRGAEMVGHTGQIDGFAALLAYLPDRDVTIVVLANDDHFDARTMGRRLAAIVLGRPYPDPVARPISAGELASLAGAYQRDPANVQNLVAKDGALYFQRGNRAPIPLQMSTDGTLHFVPDELSYFAPVRDAAGRVVRLDYFFGGDGPAAPMPRVEPAR